MRLISDLYNNSKSEHWREAGIWFSWNCFASLLPLILTMLGLSLLSKEWGISTFTDNGELAIYSASCIAGSLYLLMKDIQHKAFPSRSILALIAAILIVVASAIFMLVCTIASIGTSNETHTTLAVLNKDVLRVVSLILYPASLLFSVLVFVEDQVLVAPDINKMAKDQLDNLSNQFDLMNGGGK